MVELQVLLLDPRSDERVAPAPGRLGQGHVAARREAVHVGLDLRAVPAVFLRDFSHFAPVFYAILVILHPFFMRFWLFCISFLGAMREARAVVCRSRENHEKSRKIDEKTRKSRKITIFRES